MPPLFQAKELSYRTQNSTILSKVSFVLNENTFTTLIGPNGAGKSTLLQLMLGFKIPSRGSLIWKNHPRIGYLPQRLQIDTQFPLSVKRLFSLKPGAIESNKRKNIEHLTQICNLQDRLISELSGGELQRVLLAYALLGDPSVLLLDEPMQGLDVDAEFTFLEILKTLKQTYKKTIFMVSHDLHLVFKHSDHVICLQQHVCCQGTPSLVKDDPAYHILFEKKKDSLISTYEHQHNHTHNDGCQHD